MLWRCKRDFWIAARGVSALLTRPLIDVLKKMFMQSFEALVRQLGRTFRNIIRPVSYILLFENLERMSVANSKLVNGRSRLGAGIHVTLVNCTLFQTSPHTKTPPIWGRSILPL